MRRNYLLYVLIVSCMCRPASAQDRALPPDLSALFQAERDFAQRCGEVGIRASFLEFFAAEGIAFRPHPVKYHEAVKDRPAPPNPLAYELLWEPIFGEVSAAGDLGYDFGPSVYTDKTATPPTPQHGFFFSIWKKQTDGPWKVALDLGIQTNTAYAGSRAATTTSAKPKAKATFANAEAAHTSLLAAERAFATAVQKDGAIKAFETFMCHDARILRNGSQPLIGREAMLSYFTATPFMSTWEPQFAGVAQSGDLGYTYGQYELQKAEGTRAEKGYYVHVWKRSANEPWQVALDITTPLPE